ncbi:hypothetical protein [Algibacter pectinivorans]|uniref:Lipocalin-like domain-containing protein n=1 Tax=Algibacter pectinivorans TaxID=870482 RepID=A0A1I1QDZ6_9FLAO|nr:hypothetical protein [Algibacter pectinivorans]SFD20326.1 hypothetical protein SAMN04487987_10668 [Algibacter pectinivorans]
MKKYLCIVLLVVISSCSSDDSKSKGEAGLVGKWKLIEQYADPGDGSGEFQPLSSKRVIEFLSDGTVTINGVLCYMSNEVGDEETGTYNLITDSDAQNDGEIIPNTCNSKSARVYFDLPTSGNLILWYLCIEGCGQKFSKI